VLRERGKQPCTQLLCQQGCRYSIPGGNQGHVGCGSGQPGLVVGNPTHGKGVQTRWSLRSFSTQSILLFYDSIISQPSEIFYARQCPREKGKKGPEKKASLHWYSFFFQHQPWLKCYSTTDIKMKESEKNLRENKCISLFLPLPVLRGFWLGCCLTSLKEGPLLLIVVLWTCAKLLVIFILTCI